MATLSDIFDFERFNLKDMWNKVRKDPERLLIGAVDPFSTEVWNRLGVGGGNYEPIVNQLGGPMGSGWAGLGESGGVYERARDKGINTKWSEKSHDVAEIIASIYGGMGAAGGLGNAFGGSAAGATGGASGSGTSGGGGLFGMGDITSGWQAQNAANLESTLSGIGAPQLGGGMNWMDFVRQGQGLMGQPQQQQQQAAPPPQGLGRPPSFIEKLQSGLFPVDSRTAEAVGPEALAQQRNAAMMRMGLGMMAASNRGAGLGEALFTGMNTAQRSLDGALQQAYENAREARMEQRELDRQAIEDQRYESTREYQMEQDRIANERAQAAFDRALGLDERAQSWRDQDIAREQAQFDRQMRLNEARLTSGMKPPAGYQWTETGALEPIPGGPADPKARTAKDLPEGTQRILSYLSRMENAESNLKESGYAPTGLAGATNIAASMLPGGNFLVSKNFQKYQASAREWIAGLLRYDSGAAVPETEFQRYFKTWFAEPGDDPEMIMQKEQMRQAAIDSMKIGLPEGVLDRIGGGKRSGASGGWSIRPK